MDMFALLDRCNHAARVFAVLDNSVALGKILDGDFVADWYVSLSGDREVGIVMGDHAQHLCAGRQAFNNNNADVVLMVMNQ